MYKIKQEKSKVTIDVTIPNQQWEAEVENVYQKTKGKYNVLGFRKGKAPRKIIEKEYGDGVFFEDTLDVFYNQILNVVMQENPEFEPVDMPQVKFESYTVNDGLKMQIIFEIVPDFEICNFNGVTIGMHDSSVKESDVDHEISHMLEEHAHFHDVDRAAQNSDSVLIDFVGSVDGVEFEGGSAKNYPLVLGSGSFIDNFEDQLVGHKQGETVDVNVTFPENYGASELSGKKALFKVTINAVREKHLPTLDDNFVSNATEFETVQEYRNHVKEHIQTMKAKEEKAEFQYNIKRYLAYHTKMDIPQAMIEHNVQYDLNNLRQVLAGYGMTLEDYLLRTGSGTIEERMEQIKQDTITNIKFRYIVRKLIKDNKIVATKEELGDVSALSEQQISEKENDILLQKALEFLRKATKTKILPENEEFDWKKEQ